MYDGGNLLSTSLSATALAYSNNSIASAPASLGTGGRYFTRKLDGLFVFAADIAGLSYFDITGDLGADGSGSTDTAILTQTRNGNTYEVRPVELGKRDGERAEVLSGIKPGDPIVVEQSYLVKADIEKSGASHDH